MSPYDAGWRVLANFRPSRSVQEGINALGPDWRVHRLEAADSYLNLDYYSLKITRRPRPNGRALSNDEVFQKFKAHLLSAKRGSAGSVSFELVNSSASISSEGTLLLLKIRPQRVAPSARLGFCKDIEWLAKSDVVDRLDSIFARVASNFYDEACIVVAESHSRMLRVSTVRGPLTRCSFSFGAKTDVPLPAPGAHPVAGNREFGYSVIPDNPGGLVLYTMGADRLNGMMPGLDDLVATYGYCSAEIFWRQLFEEFATWLKLNGGAVTERAPKREKLDWLNQQFYDPTVANTVPWVP